MGLDVAKDCKGMNNAYLSFVAKTPSSLSFSKLRCAHRIMKPNTASFHKRALRARLNYEVVP
jgi:hypothetical protein